MTPARCTTLRRAACAASVALSLCGAVVLGQGLAVPVKAALAQHRLEQAFERRLAAARHGQALPGAGPVARLTVPRLNIADIVLAGNGSHDQLAQGPTMIKPASIASPVTILAAHRDTHFLFIRDLRAGDEVALHWVNGTMQRYRVTHFETVRWDRFRYPADPATPLLALATCFPFGGTEYGGPWRRIAWAEPIA